MSQTEKPGQLSIYLIITVCIGLASCASVPVFSSLPQARETIMAVQTADSGESGEALNTASSKIRQAERALEHDQPDIAERYVTEAIAYTEYAQALKRAQRAVDELEMLESNFSTLRHELEWREPLEVKPLP